MATVAFAAPSAGTGIGQLQLSIARISKLTKDQLRPPATRLSRSLPGDADQIGRLGEPAATAEEQLGIALAELRQMTTTALDPHYSPALIAVGRAFVAVSGKDPLTRTAINPEFQGLVTEIGTGATQLRRSATEAEGIAVATRKLSAELARAKRHVRALEAGVRRMRRVEPPAGSTGR